MNMLILQYSQGQVFTWLSSASESVQSWTIVLIFLLRVIAYKFLLFFNSSNVLVTLEIASTALKMRPCTFCVFRSLDLVFEWSKFLDYIFLFSKNVFLIIEPVFPWLLSWTLIFVSQFFSYWWTCFSIALKPLAISLMRSSSSLYSDWESSLLIAKLTFGFLVASNSQPICSFRSEPPHKDSSSSAGEWLSPVCLTTFLFILEFVVKVSNFFPISSLILFMFLAWLFVKISVKFFHDVSLFYC